MRDLQVSSLTSRDGVVFGGEHAFPLPPPWSPLPAENPEPAWIGEESWKRAEMTAQEIVSKIQPTLVADRKRQDIIEYVRRLVGFCAGCEVFPYGSVPLRTYLPDGDIDLSAFTFTNADDGLVSDVLNLLRAEEHNQASHYKVKDVQSIAAEVKLVKCIIDDVVVDISFNQLGGLSTLCFLEQVDRITGKDHLFKRSIILIKAWCYYESRILGAHHGLISTYGLETLVLYIVHWFHTSLKGPLGVLYTFLDYFSKFDWDNYCVSLKGPVCKLSLHDIVAEVPKKEMDDQLLSEEFLKSCQDTFSLSSDRLETNLQAFPLKHLNIIDPLKENNNLGRSVNRGNFYRIRSAFRFGARKLGWILMLPKERIAFELEKFFANTLAGHGNNCWKDVLDSNQAPDVEVSGHLSYPSCQKTFPEQKVFVEPAMAFETQGMEVVYDLANKPKRHLLKEVASQVVPEFGGCPDGDGRRPEASGILETRLADDSTGCDVLNGFLRTLIPVHSCQGPHSYTFEVQRGNGKGDKWRPSNEELTEYFALIAKVNLGCPLDHKDRHVVIKDVACPFINQGDVEFAESAVLDNVSNVSKNVDHIEKDVAGIFVSYQTLKCLLNLHGDYKSHFRNLQYAKFCHAYARSNSMLLGPPFSPLLQSKKSLEPVHKSSAFTQHVNPQSSRYAIYMGSGCCHATSFNFPCAAFGENKKRNGTGTYFPNMICRPHRNERIPGSRRNPAVKGHVPLQRHACNNGLAAASPELSTSTECRHEVEYPVLGCGKSGSSGHHQSNLSVWESFHMNAFSCPSERLEQGSLHSQKSCAAPLSESDDGTGPFSNTDPERVKVQAYHLKDEGDFPPLST